MKKIIKLSALFCMAALAIVSCQKEELDTAQFDDELVTLASFGPNPVMRGGTVTFIGSNLDKIIEVNVPGMPAISGSDIEVVESGKVSKIRVILDSELPEVGYITLKAADGTILKTKTEVTYKEPIVFDGFIANDVVYPGDIITLKGTYMDLVKTVTFEGGQEVDVLEGATRHEAEVTVPANAKSGIIVLSDGEEIESLFYSEESIKMGEPTVNANEKATLKAGDEITVGGKYLEMIASIVFDGAEIDLSEVPADSKDIIWNSEDGSWTFKLPASAKSGEYKAISYEGKEYNAGEFAAVVPVITEIAPQPVKAGGTLTISGTDLDLVTSIVLDGDKAPVFSAEETKIDVQISSAVKEGKITLTTDNGTELSADVKLVHPVISSVSPASLYAGDEPVVVSGTDLDLAVSATLGGKDAQITSKGETEIVLATDATSVSGKVAITLANGEVITSDDEVTMQYHSLVVVTSRPASQHIGQTVTLKGTNMSLVESVFIGDEKVTKFSLRSDEELSFLMPWNKVGSYPITFQLYSGDKEVQAETIEVLLEQAKETAFEGSAGVNWNNAVTIPYSKLKSGMHIIVEYTATAADYHMLRIINSDWSLNKDGDAKTNKSFEESGVWEFELDSQLYSELQGKDMALTGYGCNITNVTLITDISQEITVFKGPIAMTWDDTGRFGLAYEYFENLEPGSKMIFYITHTASWGQIQINDGCWGNSDIHFAEIGDGAYITTSNTPVGTTRVELTLTETLLNHIKSNTGGYNGANTAYTSPSGKYVFVIQGSDMQIDEITVL